MGEAAWRGKTVIEPAAHQLPSWPGICGSGICSCRASRLRKKRASLHPTPPAPPPPRTRVAVERRQVLQVAPQLGRLAPLVRVHRVQLALGAGRLALGQLQAEQVAQVLPAGGGGAFVCVCVWWWWPRGVRAGLRCRPGSSRALMSRMADQVESGKGDMHGAALWQADNPGMQGHCRAVLTHCLPAAQSSGTARPPPSRCATGRP